MAEVVENEVVMDDAMEEELASMGKGEETGEVSE